MKRERSVHAAYTAWFLTSQSSLLKHRNPKGRKMSVQRERGEKQSQEG